jgi:hypothetical protein
MKELRFEDLYPAEYYFEQNGYDCRIAIKKYHDARDTMGMAKFSLSYIEDTISEDLSKNFAKTIHLRHAIEDLNNSFDLLLQIPWMFYRAWCEFNTNGALRAGQLKNRTEIVRNTDDWVYLAEQACTYNKLQAFLQNRGNSLYQNFKDFSDRYISLENSQKIFTVRSLCNTLKHNHALQFDELYEAYDFNVKINGVETNLRKKGVGIRFSQEFFEESKPEVPLGKVNYDYGTDLSIDIEFYQGDYFKYADSAVKSQLLKIHDVYVECCQYYDALVDLFEEIHKVIYPNVQLLPSFIGSNGKPNVKHNSNSVNLNKYFTEV